MSRRKTHRRVGATLLALLTSYPALALLGKLSLPVAAQALGGSLLFAVAARLVWTRSIGRYTSASS